MVNRYFLIGTFLLLLIAPIVNDTFSIVTYERADENRVFHDSLSLNINKLDNFPSDCENYIADNFSFRTPFIQLYKNIKMNVFHVAPSDLEESVLIGSDHRFFIGSEEKKLYEREHTFSSAQLDSFQAEWLYRMNNFKKRSIKTYMLIAPTALEVYPINLPANIQQLAYNNQSMQLKNRMNKLYPNQITYPLSTLKGKAKHENLYFKLDNHWNQLGAYYAIKTLFKTIQTKEPTTNFDFMNHVAFSETEITGGYLATMIGKPNLKEKVPLVDLKETTYQSIQAFGFKAPDNFSYQFDYEKHFKNPTAKNKQKVLIIRDSFGDDCIPFLAQAYEETLFIFDAWQYGRNEEIIDRYKPDVIIYITYERYLINYIRKSN